MGGMFYWFPKLTGRMYFERAGQITFWFYFLGTNLTFFPMHFIGLGGMPRRVFYYDPSLTTLNQIATVGSFVIGLATVALFVNLLVAIWKGEKVSDNPWNAQTLEWTVSSPPTEFNFLEMPVVTAYPYEYGAPKNSKDLDDGVTA
jgi:cytochrome c oxidase subunit 1